MCSSIAANNLPLSLGDSERHQHMKIKPKYAAKRKLRTTYTPVFAILMQFVLSRETISEDKLKLFPNSPP